MKKGKTLLAVLLMLISVVASASVKIVPEPVEIHEYAGKFTLPSEVTISDFRDGKISNKDCVLMQKHILGISTLDENAAKAADISGDPSITRCGDGVQSICV